MDDEELRRRLGGFDPASSLPPADPAGVEHLLEATMADLLTDETRTDGIHHRSPLTWLVAAAAVVLLGVGALLIVGHRGSDVPVATPAPSASTSSVASSSTALTVATAAGRCAVPTAEVLGRQDLAFEGTVTSLADGVAVIVPTKVYAGSPGVQVTVAAPSGDAQALLQAVGFVQGGDYLLAASGGRVAVCGLSGASSPALSQLYEQAFRR